MVGGHGFIDPADGFVRIGRAEAARLENLPILHRDPADGLEGGFEVGLGPAQDFEGFPGASTGQPDARS
jgi:hypothetical protein